MHVERQVLFWIAALILFAVGVLVLRDVLLPFVAGLVIAYALNPIVDRLGALGVPRMLGSAFVVALVISAIVTILIVLVPLLIAQGHQLLLTLPVEADRLKAMVEAYAKQHFGSTYTDALDKVTAELASNSAAIAGVMARSLLSHGLAIVNLVSFVLITPLVVFYLLVDWKPMLAKVDSCLPVAHAQTIRRLASDIDAAISAFIRGQGLVCIILAMVYAVALSFVGLRYGLLIGVTTGILCCVPLAGWALGLIVALTVAFLQFWPETLPIWAVAGVFAFGMALDAGLLGPVLVGSRIGLHPVWLLFALFVFSYLFGFVGTLMAVPLAAASAVLLRYGMSLYLGSSFYDEANDRHPGQV